MKILGAMQYATIQYAGMVIDRYREHATHLENLQQGTKGYVEVTAVSAGVVHRLQVPAPGPT